MKRVSSLAAWITLLALTLPAAAFAHAGPQVRQIFFEKSGEAVLVANRGLMIGDPAKGDWQLMCNDVLNISTSDRLDVVETPDGRWLATTAQGLLESANHGCDWHPAATLGAFNIPSLAQAPNDGSTLYASTYAPGETGLRVSHDGGRSWATLLVGEDTDFIRYIRIHRADPKQLYMVKLSFAGMAFVYRVLRSRDAGMSWEAHEVAVQDSETDLELLGVSPYDPDFILMKAQASDQVTNAERLIVSHDGGKTFDEPIKLHVITAATWSSDQKTIWLATDDGLYRSVDDAHSFERVGAAELVSCAVEHDGLLLACGWYEGIAAGNPGIGASRDGGETFDHWMRLNEVRAELACDAGSNTATTCSQMWRDWQLEILGGPVGAGAGGMSAAAMAGARSAANGGGAGAAGDAKPSAAGSKSPAASSGCSATAGGSDARAGWWLIGAAAWPWLRRYRRRRPATRTNPSI